MELPLSNFPEVQEELDFAAAAASSTLPSLAIRETTTTTTTAAAAAAAASTLSLSRSEASTFADLVTAATTARDEAASIDSASTDDGSSTSSTSSSIDEEEYAANSTSSECSRSRSSSSTSTSTSSSSSSSSSTSPQECQRSARKEQQQGSQGLSETNSTQTKSSSRCQAILLEFHSTPTFGAPAAPSFGWTTFWEAAQAAAKTQPTLFRPLPQRRPVGLPLRNQVGDELFATPSALQAATTTASAIAGVPARKCVGGGGGGGGVDKAPQQQQQQQQQQHQQDKKREEADRKQAEELAERANRALQVHSAKCLAALQAVILSCYIENVDPTISRICGRLLAQGFSREEARYAPQLCLKHPDMFTFVKVTRSGEPGFHLKNLPGCGEVPPQCRFLWQCLQQANIPSCQGIRANAADRPLDGRMSCAFVSAA